MLAGAGSYVPVLGRPEDDGVNAGHHGIVPPNPAVRPTILPLTAKYTSPHYASHGQPAATHQHAMTAYGSPLTSGSNVTASFFARAAQKLTMSGRKKKRAQIPPDPEPPPFPTNFCDVIRMTPPPAPPQLLRNIGRPQAVGSGKVKVMLRICPVDTSTSSWLCLDGRKKQVTLYDPSHYSGLTAPSRRAASAPPKMFAFDAIFSQDDSLTELCATSLVDIVQAVVNGADGCLFCFGHARLGKTYTMLGVDDSPQNLGVIPCAIAWLFKLINEQKDRTGARFSVRVSAVEVTGKQEKLKDLLAEVAGGTEAGSTTAPGVYLRDDPICGLQIENQSELRAPTADQASFYLDAAIAARTVPEAEEDARNSHLLFTLSVYQYRVEKSTKGQDGVAGGRSRLHLLDLGSCSKRDTAGSNALSLSALGNVILALLNGQRHVPHRDSKLTQLIKESLGNWSCRTCMIAHVSPAVHAYNETLQVIQLAARIHRMKRRSRNKWSSTSSDDSSCDGQSVRLRRMRPGVRMGILREDGIGGFSHSDPDYSSSEQSCDTVIYVGANGQALSDRELTDNEGPPPTAPSFRKSSSAPSEARIPEEEPSERTHEGGPPAFTSKLPPKSPLRHASSVAAGPVSGVVQLPRKVNAKLKSQAHAKQKLDDSASRDQTGSGEGEKWVDGPAAAPCSNYKDNGAATWRESSAPSVNEPWGYSGGREPDGQYYAGVQASGAKYYSGTAAVPTAPVVPTEVNNPQGGEHWVDGPRVPAPAPVPIKDTELWVDGPSAFRVESPAPRAGRMWTEIPKDAAKSTPKACRKESKAKARTPDAHRPAPRAAADLLEARERGNAESNSSLSVNADSEGNSCQSETDPSAPRKTQDLAVQTQPAPVGFPVKAFVHDWVLKHSIGSAECADRDPGHGDSRRSGIPRPASTRRQHVCDDLAVGGRTRSPERWVSVSAQSSPRLRRLRRHGLPVQSQLTVRTAAWVMSISEETASPHGADLVIGCSNSDSAEPICERDLPGSPPPDYDSCVEESLVGGEQRADVQKDYDSGARRRRDDQPSVADPDADVCDAAPSGGGASSLDVDSLLLCNRESIYELQMDEQLECTETARKIASGSDDLSAWSSGSYQNVSVPRTESARRGDDDDDPASPCRGDNESGIASGSGGPTSPLDEKPPDGKLVRPSSLRRPDGASNPNLADIAAEKDVVSLDGERPSGGEPLPLVKCASEPIRNPAADGQSPTKAPDRLLASRLPVRSPSQPTTRAVPCPKPPSARSGRSFSLPVRNVSRPSPSEPSSVCSSTSSSPTKSASTPASAKTSPVKTANKSKLTKLSGGSPSQERAHFSRSSSTKSNRSSKPLSSTSTSTATTGSAKNASALKTSSAGKECKSSSRVAGKSPSPSKRDRVPRFSGSLAAPRSRHTDSDSGNDSGIVKNDRKFLSPYSKPTKPRLSSYSASSGHGSDNSSTFAGANGPPPAAPPPPAVGLHKIESSSGYDSMLREDSEITGASSHDSTSESSCGGNSRGGKPPKKKDKSGRRSRSAPARSTSESPASCSVQSPSSCRRLHVVPSSRAWVDTRRCKEVVIEPLELKSYDEEELEKMARRRREAQLRASEKHSLKVAELLVRQEQLKNELMEAKAMLMVDKSTWSFDLHVAEHMDRDEPGYLEALEKETSILEKRVEACKSRIMLVTCFDV